MSRSGPFVLRRPEQGWSSLLLLLGMLVVLGVSVADSRPLTLTGSDSLTDSLWVLMLAAGLIGYLLARSSLGVVRAHVIGAAVAALMLLLIAGGGLIEQSPLPDALGGVGERIGAVWTRLDTDISGFIAAEITTPTITTFLVLGAICWTTAQFSAFSVFRYDRGGPAVMSVGTILFLNVGLGSVQAESELLPVVPVLALFAVLALLLLMRLQLVQQRYAWARRHISDAQDVSRLFLRTGVGFVLIAVLGASSLTVWATVEAQDVKIDRLQEPLEDVADEVSRMLGLFGVPSGREMPSPLGTSTELRSDWNQPDGVAFTAEFDDGQLYGNYWWGSSNDRYDYQAERWTTTGSDTASVPAGGQLSPPRRARAGGALQADVTITIDEGYSRTNLFRLPDVLTVDRDVTARKVSGDGIDAIEYAEPLAEGETVRFTSFVRDYSPGDGDFTASDLRNDSGEDPPWVLDKYLQGADNERIVGDKTRALADELSARWDTRYDQAFRLQERLRRMDYDPSLGDACAGFDALPECLLTIERGFCQQYATTMVMTLRAMGIPARFVTGYLPGEQGESGRWVVEQQALHNWAEVYFPDFGWVRFDPTPSEVGYGQVPTDPLEGESAPETRSPQEPDTESSPPESAGPEESFDAATFLEDERPGSGGDRLLIVVGLGAMFGLLLTVVSLLLLFRLRRLPEGDDSLAYRGIVNLATRLGHGPHPAQTEYEYAGTLSETIPTVRDDLFVVTAARVESAYGGRHLDEDQRGTLRGAYARIRTALLRLSLRWRR